MWVVGLPLLYGFLWRRGLWRHLNNMLVAGNWSSYAGGGASDGTLNNCTIDGNSATGASIDNYGGGAYNCTLNNCMLIRNSSSHVGGGVSGGNLNSCALARNSAWVGGGSSGAAMNNCTLTGNSASTRRAAGLTAGTLNNCILYYNTANSDPNYYGGTPQSTAAPRPCRRWGRQHHRRAATGQRLPPQRRFALPRGRQRGLRDRRGH